MEEKTEKFDYEAFEKEAMKQLLLGKPLSGSEGVLTPLVGSDWMEATLRGELSAHLAEEPPGGNRRNGHGRKRVKTAHGEVDIATRGTVPGRSTRYCCPSASVLNAELDTKHHQALRAGMSQRDISDHVRDLYGIEVSEATISAVTDQTSPTCRLGAGAPGSALRHRMAWMPSTSR
ncbi:MAG: transposase [Flavobacteriales bacterium]